MSNNYRLIISHTNFRSITNPYGVIPAPLYWRSEPRRGLALGGCSEDGAEFGSAAELCKGGLFVQPFREAAGVFSFRFCPAERVHRAFTVPVHRSGHCQIAEGPHGIGVGNAGQLKIVFRMTHIFLI